VVTGSTSGIGRAIAEALAKAGATVVVNGRTESTVRKVVGELKSKYDHSGVDFIGFTADVSTKVGAEHLLSCVSALGQPVHILVNCVGLDDFKDYFDFTDYDWQKSFDANLMSGVRLSRGVLNGMLSKGEGRIIMISSDLALRPNPSFMTHSVMKAAQLAFVKGLSELTKGSKVTVNSLVVGPTFTRGMEDTLIKIAEQRGVASEVLAETFFKDVEPGSVIDRYINPEEVAAFVLFLASDQAKSINGSAQRIDGGIVKHV
ncbi:hypothetical protein CBR_g78151, partial [Chara braunii]